MFLSEGLDPCLDTNCGFGTCILDEVFQPECICRPGYSKNASSASLECFADCDIYKTEETFINMDSPCPICDVSQFCLEPFRCREVVKYWRNLLKVIMRFFLFRPE